MCQPWGWLALVAGRQQQFDRMRELAQEALELARTARFSLLEARMLSHLADAASGLSDYEEAERLLTPALRIYREHQHHFYIDLTLGKLADVTRCSGDFARAKELVQKGINDYIDNCRSYVNWRHR
ncbi:tetratricopeptide repeat protein [Chloroflexi bacterium TSY]|nr:tetratricopeptide repeat protein [Chloroflexi bacterium TSY]